MESNVFTSGRWIVLQAAEGETEGGKGRQKWGSVDVTSVPATPLGATGSWEPSPAPMFATGF